MNTTERCGLCRFFLGPVGAPMYNRGECRRFPPVQFIDMEKGPDLWHWPTVFGLIDWCGEFKAKDSEA